MRCCCVRCRLRMPIASCTSIRTLTKARPESSSFPAYRAIAGRRDVFASAAAVFNTSVTAETDSGVRQSFVEFASSSYFPVLGLSASRGRWFTSADDRRRRARDCGRLRPRLAHAFRIRSRHGRPHHAAWWFGGDDRRDWTARTTTGLSMAPLWISGCRYAALGPVIGSFAAQTLERPQDHWFMIRARLRDGVTLEQARAAMASVSNELATRFAGLDQTRRISVLPAADVRIHPSFDSTFVPAAVLLMAVVGSRAGAGVQQPGDSSAAARRRAAACGVDPHGHGRWPRTESCGSSSRKASCCRSRVGRSVWWRRSGCCRSSRGRICRYRMA